MLLVSARRSTVPSQNGQVAGSTASKGRQRRSCRRIDALTAPRGSLLDSPSIPAKIRWSGRVLTPPPSHPFRIVPSGWYYPFRMAAPGAHEGHGGSIINNGRMRGYDHGQRTVSCRTEAGSRGGSSGKPRHDSSCSYSAGSSCRCRRPGLAGLQLYAGGYMQWPNSSASVLPIISLLVLCNSSLA
eukprot:SAG22_NODE_597_length_8708_cov_11.511209_1_plen_185_part_00